MREIELPSGRKAVINCASLAEALDLKEGIFASLSGMVAKDLDSYALIGAAVCSIESSRGVRDALYKCFTRCTINLEKITPLSFDGYFEDYAVVEMEVIKENFLPFTKGLLSAIGGLATELNKMTAVPK